MIQRLLIEVGTCCFENSEFTANIYTHFALEIPASSLEQKNTVREECGERASSFAVLASDCRAVRRKWITGPLCQWDSLRRSMLQILIKYDFH